MPKQHDITLTIDAKMYGGWKSISIARSIEAISGAYEIGCSNVPADSDAAGAIIAGAQGSIQLDGETIITGFIDDVEISHGIRDHSLSVSGRDASADLVDCAAIYKSGEWQNQTMLAIAKNLCEPFKVTVTADTNVSKPFSSWNIEPGESVFENMERMARAHGVLLVSDGLGGIKITRASKEKVFTTLALGKNILSATARVSHAQRYSEYRILAQHSRSDDYSGTASTEGTAVATDTTVKRKRPLVEIFEDGNADTETLLRRAEWKRNISAGRAQRVNVTVQGWSHSNGVWKPNTLVTIDHPPLRLDSVELLIVSTRQVLDDNGSRTELQLSPAKAYEPESVPGDAFQ